MEPLPHGINSEQAAPASGSSLGKQLSFWLVVLHGAAYAVPSLLWLCARLPLFYAHRSVLEDSAFFLTLTLALVHVQLVSFVALATPLDARYVAVVLAWCLFWPPMLFQMTGSPFLVNATIGLGCFGVVLMFLVHLTAFGLTRLLRQPDLAPTRPWQFSLRATFLFVTGMALLFGLARHSAYLGTFTAVREVSFLIVISTIPISFGFLTAFPVSIAFSATSPAPLAILQMLFLSLIALAVAAPFEPHSESAIFGVFFGPLHTLGTTGTLCLLRRQGYRLVPRQGA